jgi:hypothetical protein
MYKMPTNVTAEYAAAEQEYQNAGTTQEKIKALENMLSKCPTHKGCEKLRQDIKTKLAKFKGKLEKELTKKGGGKSFSIKKEGAAQIVIVGPPNSGKSLLLNRLTNTKVEVADYDFTTKKPGIGIMKYKGVKIQVVEVPAIVDGSYYSEKGPQLFSIVRTADLVLIVTDTSELDNFFREFEHAKIQLNEPADDEEHASVKGIILANKDDCEGSQRVYEGLCRYYNFDIIRISVLKEGSLDKLKDKIWDTLGLIKVYTKEPGKKVRKDEPVCLKKGSKISDMAVHIHKDFIRKFRFARVWGDSAKFPGQRVGLRHTLKDDDIVEMHLK